MQCFVYFYLFSGFELDLITLDCMTLFIVAGQADLGLTKKAHSMSI